MPTDTNTKKPALIMSLFAAGAAIIVVLIVVLVSIKPKPSPPPAPGNPDSGDKTAAVTVKSSPSTDSLTLLPESFPIEANAAVTHNYATTSPEQGQSEQYTRSYVSTKSLSVNFQTFKSYLEENGWAVTTATSLNQNSILATKGQVAIDIIIQSQGSVRIVTITTSELDQPTNQSELVDYEG